jgi:superfamily II DNA or RNA helicase
MSNRKKLDRNKQVRRRSDSNRARGKSAIDDIVSDINTASSWRDSVGEPEKSVRSVRPIPKTPSRSDWAGPASVIGAYVKEESNKTLESYHRQPNLIIEHANLEEDTARGGYAARQLFELVQNSADALAGSSGGRIRIRLTPTHLYCADEGRPIDMNGVRALMFSHLSSKRGTEEIGRFGLGFKSLLGVSDTPEFFSRSGSFRFNRSRAAELIQPILPKVERYPVLRLPEAIDPWPEMANDPVLRDLMCWGVNIVRLPLKEQAVQTLDKQIGEFPSEFLLFVRHIAQLVFYNEVQGDTRTLSLQQRDNLYILNNGENLSRWMIAEVIHILSPDAQSDRRSLDDGSQVPIKWAVPIDRLNEPGKFWTYFPTMTTSLLAGILNAPWKTNEDRQNLLPGVYNDELIDAAAKMVANTLPLLSTPSDPAKHLDALPRRREAWDSKHSERLRNQLLLNLRGVPLVPDQDGVLKKSKEISYPPDLSQTENRGSTPYERWAAFDQRPRDWLHHSALRRERLSRIESYGDLVENMSASRATVRQWLEALVQRAKSPQAATACPTILSNSGPVSPTSDRAIIQERARKKLQIVRSSMAAIQTAALIPTAVRDSTDLGNIILTADGKWVKPAPDAAQLSGDEVANPINVVHPLLEKDRDTLQALKKLGLRPASTKSTFGTVASALLAPSSSELHGRKHSVQVEQNIDWGIFWQLAREIEHSEAIEIIESFDKWREYLRVRTIRGNWRSLFMALLPGPIVPDDGSRDSDVAIDTEFHKEDIRLLECLGAVNAPRSNHELSQKKNRDFTSQKRNEFCQRDLPQYPQQRLLFFKSSTTSGPLDVMEKLSDEGKAIYTWHLLGLPSTYEPWTMQHRSRSNFYPPLECTSPALELLQLYGRIKTREEIQNFSEGLGDPPRNWAVAEKLLAHPQSNLIREVFGLPSEANIPVEPFGEDDPIPITDIWPGLKPWLSAQIATLHLLRCDGFRKFDDATTEDGVDCQMRDGVIYLRRCDDERDELCSVLQQIGLSLHTKQIEEILRHRTPEEIEEARDIVRRCLTDDERLLSAVGETELRQNLPESLITILEQAHGILTGRQVAQAAIATFHTGALREYRHALDHLDPPKKWAGSQRAVDFVRSLGFGEEWAGERNTRRDPFIEVEGPYSLPKLHDYQQRIVRNVKELIRSNGTVDERRGMISMPTGSGKTRVAVQSIVEAIRDDDFEGGILWVADRDELCEQAVEAWRQVWASEGAQATQLRISRMWAGQPRPLPTIDKHVIVATIQTLSAKIAKQPESYEFLADFMLLIFDEAHRSVARTYTSVMQELGLTQYKKAHEPYLIGLTATPYRGHDQEETRRLVNRYSSNRLDAGAFESDEPEAVIQELQSMSILAQADQETISGSRLFLSGDELRQTKQTPWLPQSVENRLADDISRTQRIIEAYEEHILRNDPDWPTLIFATSVKHSQTVATLITSLGVRARAVSATTDTSSRRRIVEEFRSGAIKVLVNYGIFREGFDAPKTRAIIVARPVYSPNLYFQMIGRGLRGVKNGGNDRCLILNVEDNIANFQRKLAFSDLDWLWA